MGRFSRTQISLGKQDFSRVFKQNQKSGDRLFLVLARTSTVPFSRLGLAISKKHAARAVDRNRIKRLIRESFYHTEFPIDLDIVVMNRSGLKQSSNQEITQSLSKHWQRILNKINKT